MKPTHVPLEKTVVRHPPLSVWLAYLLVCTLLLTGVSFARYIATTNGSDTARVAAGMVTVSYREDATAIQLVRPANDGVLTEDFGFSVSNGSSEVAIRYDVIVTLDKPLEEGVTMTLDGEKGTESEDRKQYEFSGMGTFAAGVEQTQNHTLSFAGDFDSIRPGTDDTYNIKISICSQQIN